MARARNIKPAFFKNELLAELSPFDRLLFIGLWCLGDREGRVEDRPKRIKMELFPCDSYDVDAGLNELAKQGFVRRYTAAGEAVIAIVNFTKHQTPHGTEKDSELPDENGELTVNERTPNGYVTGTKRRNNVNSESNNGDAVLSAGVDVVNPPTKNTLNPDSLNPDSLIPDSSVGTAPRKRAATPPASAIAKPDDVDQQTWADWLTLRKAKRAPVTQTVVDDAQRECAKAGMTLENFLRVWCRRGSQGLEAAWLKPDERAGPRGNAGGKYAAAASTIFGNQTPEFIDV